MTTTANDPAENRAADSPLKMSGGTWWQVLKRAWAESNDDNIGLIAAGIAFYGFTTIVPVLASIVLIYGLVADTSTVVSNIRALFGVLPDDAARLIGDQLATVVGTSEGKKGFGLIIALGIALYGGTKGASSAITGLNIAYEQRETRGFVALNLLAFGVTIGAVVLALAAALSTAAFALIDSLIPGAPEIVLTGVRLASYAVLALFAMTAAACLYRFGPNREKAKWVWLTPGSVAATLVWLAATLGFGFYVSRFGNYGATYGSLSAVIVLLTWLWLSAYVFLLGAELNAELERQTSSDTTTGPARPMGERGAVVADTVASAAIAEDPAPVPKQPGLVLTSAQVSAATRLIGPRIGVPATLLAAGGLGALRRGSPRNGLLLLAAGAILAWTTRPARPKSPKRNA
ncbi:YihY/virulence factor BrkB family protein [Sphingomonas sp. R86521]|uniref:YihY/virulence factor BrkB family protein n=1 Tax=Sphingomonas sp. R86521 TaxID=3093860 RepID=UPI0036D24942